METILLLVIILAVVIFAGLWLLIKTASRRNYEFDWSFSIKRNPTTAPPKKPKSRRKKKT